MKSASQCREKAQNDDFLLKEEVMIRFHFLTNIASGFVYLTCLTLIILFCFQLLYYTKTTNPISTFIQPRKDMEKYCDLFKGEWIRDTRGPLYTNYSCSSMPVLKNCFLQGRKDKDFLQWRWKPDKCELPRFSPETFFSILRGKTMAFIGDSIARNQMDSLVCLLSTVETPKQIHRNDDDQFPTFEFPKHNLTVRALWSPYLVAAAERVVNGSATGAFDLHLDKIDKNWSEKLPTIDYAVFSAAHWFFRENYLYDGGNLIGCVYHPGSNGSVIGPEISIRKAFRAAFKAINNCTNCRKISTFLRTYSPSHFENGTWNTGGVCNRTRPFGRDEINKDGPDWEYRKIQGEEIEIARSAGEESGNMFEIVDVTEIMLMRGDGHPGVYWGNKYVKGINDCLHWCLPGPIDVWNELLLELIKRRNFL